MYFHLILPLQHGFLEVCLHPADSEHRDLIQSGKITRKKTAKGGNEQMDLHEIGDRSLPEGPGHPPNNKLGQC